MSGMAWVMIVILGASAGVIVPGHYDSKEECVEAAKAAMVHQMGKEAQGLPIFACVPTDNR